MCYVARHQIIVGRQHIDARSEDWPLDGNLCIKSIWRAVYRLDEINCGYADLDSGKNLRGVVVFDHSL
jgi:Zn-dependent alcohol dehydrogenase